MRVEPAPYVFRNQDRRQRPEQARAQADRRQSGPDQPNARTAADPWLAPAFGAHLLGQLAPQLVSGGVAARAYTQPESRTPLRPRVTQTA